MHPQIGDLLAYATAKLPMVLLSNVMLLRGARLHDVTSIDGVETWSCKPLSTAPGPGRTTPTAAGGS